MALKQRRPLAGLLHHSDRGSQYASQDYQTLLTRHQFQPSMSRRGNCYDNAPMESFFASLKTECIQGIVYPTRAVARAELFDYIELFYNRQRIHSQLGYRSPAAYEQLPLVA
jgi:transposase InsO family protein